MASFDSDARPSKQVSDSDARPCEQVSDSDARPCKRGLLSRRASVFLLGFAVWSWVIWPTFLVNLWDSARSWQAGSPTGYFVVHAVLALVSLILGTIIGVLGWRGFVATRSR